MQEQNCRNGNWHTPVHDTAGAELACIIKFCLDSDDDGLQSEAAWLCANLTAAPDRSDCTYVNPPILYGHQTL